MIEAFPTILPYGAIMALYTLDLYNRYYNEHAWSLADEIAKNVMRRKIDHLSRGGISYHQGQQLTISFNSTRENSVVDELKQSLHNQSVVIRFESQDGSFDEETYAGMQFHDDMMIEIHAHGTHSGRGTRVDPYRRVFSAVHFKCSMEIYNRYDEYVKTEVMYIGRLSQSEVDLETRQRIEGTMRAA